MASASQHSNSRPESPQHPVSPQIPDTPATPQTGNNSAAQSRTRTPKRRASVNQSTTSAVQAHASFRCPPCGAQGGGSGCANNLSLDAVALEKGDVERTLDLHRSRCFVVAVTQLVFGFVMIPFCWVGYGFVFAALAQLITFGVLGVVHFRTMDSLRYSTCCCVPLNAIKHLHTCYVVTAIFAFLGIASCIVQVATVSPHDVTERTFAIIASLLCVVALVATLAGIKLLGILREVAVLDDVIANSGTPASTHSPNSPQQPTTAVAVHQPQVIYVPQQYALAPAPSYYCPTPIIASQHPSPNGPLAYAAAPVYYHVPAGHHGIPPCHYQHSPFMALQPQYTPTSTTPAHSPANPEHPVAEVEPAVELAHTGPSTPSTSPKQV